VGVATVCHRPAVTVRVGNLTVNRPAKNRAKIAPIIPRPETDYSSRQCLVIRHSTAKLFRLMATTTILKAPPAAATFNTSVTDI